MILEEPSAEFGADHALLQSDNAGIR